MKFYLYGRGEPEVWSLLREPALQAIAGRLLASGVTVAGADEEPVAASAERCALLERCAEGLVPGPRLVLVPAAAESVAQRFMEGPMERYVDIAAGTIPAARAAFEAGRERTFSWDQVCHAVVAGLFLDLSVGSRLWRSGMIEREHWQTVAWAFERISAANGFGVQWVGDQETRCAVAQLWHCRVARDDLSMTGKRARLLCAIARGDAVEESPELLLLRYRGWVRRRPSGELRLRIPAFLAADLERLLEPLSAGARLIVDEVVAPVLAGLGRLPWWRERAGVDTFRHAAVRLVLEYGVDRVLAAGLLAPFPAGDRIPDHWGRWLWQETASGPELVAGAFTASAARPPTTS